MSIENYKKFTYRVAWSEEDYCYIGTCVEIPSLSVCEETQEEALKEIKVVVLESLKWLQEQGKKIPEPLSLKKYSGKLTIRVPEETHREIALRAVEEGVSINKYILSKITLTSSK